MTFDPETSFALPGRQPLAPTAATGSTPAVPTQESGPTQTPPEGIVGEHFLWARGSVLLTLW